MLPPSVRASWAKSSPDGSWMPLDQHLYDTCAVAGLLWDHWVPGSVRDRIRRDLADLGSARVLVTFLAGLHDLGKITPAFAAQKPALLPHMAAAGLTGADDARGRSRDLPHGLAGGLALRGWLRQSRGWPGPAADALAVVIAGHHGLPPPDLLACPLPDLMGDAAWSEARTALIEDAVERYRVEPFLDGWRRRPPGPAVQALVTGIVVVADWLASNVDLFPYVTGDTQDRAGHAWRDLGLPSPWCPAAADAVSPTYWSARFAVTAPRPVQAAVVDAITTAIRPLLVLVEAPMGEGKTEAALAAAESLAHRYGSGGVMVALPTMATSNAMFGRVLGWLNRLPPPTTGEPWSTFLAHGKAGLNDDFRGLPVSGIGDVGRGEEDSGGAAVAHSWLSGRRKGVLSTFVVGTIDQVLVGALEARHLVLRHLALAGKVVILDEVHAADEYMSVYLERVLAWLGEYGVPTILLSATLPPARRDALVRAYRSQPAEPVRTGWGGNEKAAVPAPAAYPLITLVDGDEVRNVPVAAGGRSSAVTLRRLDDSAVVATVADLLADGGTAAVVCNTVARSQRVFREMRAVLGDDVVLLHSRFLAADRQRLERQVCRALGPPDEAARPGRLVIVGTQVLEQSLDIDIDVMVTDLAPVDLVLQRIGRLHRHAQPSDARPAAVREPVCFVAGVRDWSAPVPSADAGSRAVYGEAALIRAATVLAPHLDGRVVRLPEDIPLLVADAYGPYDEQAPDPRWPAELAAAEATARADRVRRQISAGAFLLRAPNDERPTLLGWLEHRTQEESPGGQAAVRDGLQGVEVLLLEDDDGTLRIPGPPPGGGQVVPAEPDENQARAALGCAVRLPDRCTDAAVALAADLSGPAGWSRSGWLRDVLVLRARPDGDALRASLGPHDLRYDPVEGLTVTRGDRP